MPGKEVVIDCERINGEIYMKAADLVEWLIQNQADDAAQALEETKEMAEREL